MAAANKLDWVDNSTNETDFSIERATGTGAFAEIGKVASNVTTYTDTTVVEGTAYSYRVAAINATGKSTYSNVVSKTIPLSVPAAPSNLVITLTVLIGIQP
jgi:hypothetical protein